MNNKQLVIINHFAGIPNINEQSLRHFIIAEKLQEYNFDVTIICSQNHYNSPIKNKFKHYEKIKIEGINYIFVDEIIFKKKNLFTKAINMFYFAINLFAKFFLGKIRFSRKIDYVFSSSPDLFTAFVGLIFAKFHRSKHILEIRDIWPLSQIVHHNFSNFHPLILFMKGIENFLYKNSDIIISTCHNFDRYLKEKNYNKPFLFIPPLVKKFDYTQNKKIFKHFEHFEKIGIYAGTIGNFYGLETIVKNFPRQFEDKIGILLIGGGDAYDKIKKMIIDYKRKNFFIMPQINHDILVSYYNLANFAIAKIPFADELYQYGINQLKIPDYMYHKLPVLFIGNPNHVCISSDRLIVCSKEDDKSYLNSFSKIYSLSNEELAYEGINNYEYVMENFESSDYVKELIQMMDQL